MTEDSPPPSERVHANEVRRRKYAREAPTYDREMDFSERWVFGTEHRGWACSQAVGDTLEVAIGTGLNLPHYPTDVRLLGVDLSPEMLALAESAAKRIGRTIELSVGDAQDLPFADHSFDTVVCTYGLCSVSEDAKVIIEMNRVLRPGGRLILVDHIRSSITPIFWFQWLYEVIWSRPRGGYVTRRPALHVMAAGFQIEVRDRLRAGIVERLVALKPDK